MQGPASSAPGPQSIAASSCRSLHHWYLGAQTTSPVRAYEFDATVVRELCGKDPELPHELWAHVAKVVGSRLRSARVRLLDLYAPYGAGDVP